MHEVRTANVDHVVDAQAEEVVSDVAGKHRLRQYRPIWRPHPRFICSPGFTTRFEHSP
jgi:hypothetical protein